MQLEQCIQMQYVINKVLNSDLLRIYYKNVQILIRKTEKEYRITFGKAATKQVDSKVVYEVKPGDGCIVEGYKADSNFLCYLDQCSFVLSLNTDACSLQPYLNDDSEYNCEFFPSFFFTKLDVLLKTIGIDLKLDCVVLVETVQNKATFNPEA